MKVSTTVINFLAVFALNFPNQVVPMETSSLFRGGSSHHRRATPAEHLFELKINCHNPNSNGNQYSGTGDTVSFELYDESGNVIHTQDIGPISSDNCASAGSYVTTSVEANFNTYDVYAMKLFTDGGDALFVSHVKLVNIDTGALQQWGSTDVDDVYKSSCLSMDSSDDVSIGSDYSRINCHDNLWFCVQDCDNVDDRIDNGTTGQSFDHRIYRQAYFQTYVGNAYSGTTDTIELTLYGQYDHGTRIPRIVTKKTFTNIEPGMKIKIDVRDDYVDKIRIHIDGGDAVLFDRLEYMAYDLTMPHRTSYHRLENNVLSDGWTNAAGEPADYFCLSTWFSDYSTIADQLWGSECDRVFEYFWLNGQNNPNQNP